VTVGKVRKFYLHRDLLVAESEKFSRQLNGAFKEASENAVELDEDPELFGYFVEYIYRNRSVLSRDVGHYSEYITLARLYAMAERLIAPGLQSHCLWRFTKPLTTDTKISEEVICDLLEIACTEIPERIKKDALRSQIFWYAGVKLSSLQKSDMFRQLLCDVPEVGHQVCLMVNQGQPPKPAMPNELNYDKFKQESEYSMRRTIKPSSTGTK
jgi:hypothetical protein